MQKNTKSIRGKKIIIIAVCIIIALSMILIKYLENKKQKEMSNLLNTVDVVDTSETSKEQTERMLKVEELKKENKDIVGWLEIEGTNINYPVLQGIDNEYYMTHTYNKEYSKDGSLFLDKDYNWDLPSTNLLIYGHNNKNGNMFNELLKYKEESFYREHPTIRFTTPKEDAKYEILSVFKSRVYYKNETNVFRYYYFINADKEEEYNNFIKNCKKVSLYNIETTAEYGEQLLTLSTCEYSQKNGRFAIVAKKINN